MNKITLHHANQVRNAVERQFKAYVLGMESRPSLHGNYTGVGVGEFAEPVPFALVWEDGPFEWALNAFTDHVDEELTELLWEFDRELPPAQVAAVDIPDGVTVEPLTSFVLAIYPRED